MAPVNNQPIGKVFIVYGTVKAVSPAGVERILTPNSPIYAHERIVTGPDGSVSVALTGQQGHLDLGRMSDVLLDDDVYGGGGHEGTTDAVAQVEDIQTALQDENFDPTTDLPATAAGAGVSGAGAGARGGGRQVVVFTADQMEVLPDSGAETRGVSLNFLDPPPGGQPEESQAPIDTVPIVGHAELTFDEANLPDGTSPDAGSLVKGGSLADLGVSFGSDAPGILDFGNGQIMTIDGSGTSLVVAGTYGDLTINGDGSWTYILKDNTLDHSVPGGTGTTDQVADQFTFAAVDSDGSRAEGGSVVIHILDDGPRLSVGNQAVDESTDLGHGVQGTLDFAFGADGAGSLALSAEGAVWDAASKTLTGAGNEWVLHVNDDGTYTFTQNDAMHHSDPTNPDDSLPITVTALVTDGDGDSVSKDFTITVKDDGPRLSVGDQAVDESTDLGHGVQGTLDFAFGADGAGSLALSAEGAVWDAASKTLTGAGNEWVLHVNDDGTYTFTQNDAMHHSDPTNPDDSLPITVTALVTDGDGDSVSKDFTITVKDDGPRLSVGDQAVDESTDLGHGVQGTLDFAFGADGAGSLALSAEGAVWDAASKTLTGAGNEWVLHVNDDGTYTFTQNDAMHHSDPTNPDDSLPITVTALVTDGDGDSVSKDFTITVKDDGPAAGHPQDAILANETGNHVTGNLDIDFGNDGPASSLALQLGDAHGSSLVGQAVVDDQGHALTSGGMQLIYEDDGAGGVHAVIAGTHDAVFSVSLDDAAGTYTVTMGPHALDAVQSTALFSGAGGGGNNASADFAASESLNVHVTATSSNGPDPDAAYVQWDSGGIGVNSGSGTEKYIGPNDVLTMEFQGGDGQSQAIESIHFTLTGLGQTSDGVQTYTEIARYVTYLNGEIVDQGTISGDADGRVDFSLQSTGAFDTITFEAANKSTWYQIQSITVDNDPSLSYSVLATDGDGDTARTDAFHVTFDADGNITGTDHSEVIAGSSGDDIIRGGGGDDVIDGRDGNDMIDGGAGHDHITGGAGADTFIDLEAGAGEVHDQTPLDHLVGSIGQHP